MSVNNVLRLTFITKLNNISLNGKTIVNEIRTRI